MSINDLMNDDNFLPMLFVIIVVISIVAAPIGIILGKQMNRKIYGDNESGAISEERNAKVLTRRSSPHPLNQTIMVNMVVFELSSGRRMEFAVKDANKYAIMVEGDCGTLRHRGNKFIGFERNS